ncbi:MAG: tetratricopeptide repeat protein [Candidatus Gastranaerophilaceae bacterium]|nr:tetratricopeptide repeat protein [Candidatus Gastranaerophilaceae bacterium]
MNRKLVLLLSLLVISNPVFADFKEHFDLGTEYLSNYQYSGAITEFKNALRINYKDNSARIQIINAYMSRGQHFANTEKDWEKAANDYRSALFYMQMFPTGENAQVSSAIGPVTQNLNICLNVLKFDKSPVSRFNKAKELRAEGNFSAAAYEFSQSLGEASQIKSSYSQIGDIMKILGNEPKAAEYYRKALAIDPADVPLRLAYAKLLDKLGSEEAAVQEYNYILSKSVDNNDVLYALERIYKKKLEDSPSDADLNANLGAILQKQNKYDEALEHYKKAEQLSPSNINTRINVGTLYQQKGDYKTAIIAYDSVLILEPNNINANIYKAQCKAALGEDRAAQDIYKKVLALDPGNTLVQNELYNSAKNTMSPAAFIEYLNKNASGIDTTEMLYAYALDLHKAGKLEDAKTLYNYLLPKDKTGEIYLNLAITESQQKNYKDALNVLNEAKTKFPDNQLIAKTITDINDTILSEQLDEAAAAFNNKDYEKAIEAYLKVVPPTSDTMLAIASAYQNLDDNVNAIIYYKKAFELKPGDSEIAYYIAALYADKEDWDSAEAYAQKSLLLNKNNKDAQNLLAEIKKQGISQLLEQAIALFDSQNYEQSLPLLNQVISAEDKNAYALYYRGMVYDAMEKYSEAIADYKNAIAVKPDDLKIINYNLAVDYDAQEKYKEAYEYYMKYSESDVPDDEYKTYATDRAKELKTYVEQSTKPVADKK